MHRGEHWTAFVPFAARWPIEVHLLPHRQLPDFAATNEAERAELATLYLRLLRGSTRSTTPRPPTSRPGIRRRCTTAATPSDSTCS